MKKEHKIERDRKMRKYIEMIEYEFSQEDIFIPSSHYDFLFVVLKKVYNEGYFKRITDSLN